ncbi:MAG: DUF1549 domain-containing protein, partial [Gemmataceae bacterium]|nr:DUF1549 domain-containing protein [Gemmataceae bacterium]
MMSLSARSARRRSAVPLVTLSLAGFLTPIAVAADLPPPAARTIDFRRDVYPLLKQHCFACHQGADAQAGYRLDQRADLLGETDGRTAVRIGASDRSRLIQLVAGQVPGKIMPLKGPRLTAEQVGILRAWIDQGLAWDDELLPVEQPRSDHWAFQPVKRPPIPAVANSAWVRTPVDAFIAAAQQRQGVVPAPPAPRRTLIRRLAFDLTGLPPSAAEIDEFVNDPSPHAYEKLVERLLASPHYGERWGRHWLDLARFAESEGYESDHTRPYAWRYRDYVIASFNHDKPYDRFLREQIAGDEIEPYSDENLIATGFLAAARLSSNEEDRARQRNDVLVDIVNATAAVVLGVTLHCAQCHNHKFDPFTARDYYRFQGFFVKGAPNNLTLRDPNLWAKYERAKPAGYDAAKARLGNLLDAGRDRLVTEARRKLTEAQRNALDTPEERRTPEQERLAHEAELTLQFTPDRIERAVIDSPQRQEYEALKRQIAAMEKAMPDVPQTWGFYSPATSPTRIDVLPMKGFYPPPYIPAQLARARPYLLIAGDVHERAAPLEPGWPAL